VAVCVSRKFKAPGNVIENAERDKPKKVDV